MEKNQRNCPKCGKLIAYTYVGNFRAAEKKKSCCISCAKKEAEIHKGKLQYERNCPKCGKVLIYVIVANCRTAERKNRWCMSCVQKQRVGEKNSFYGKHHTDRVKKIISQSDRSSHKTEAFSKKMSSVTSGNKNPMFGKKVYDIWVEKYGEEKANQLNLELRKKISITSSGANNPMYGKPTPQGAGNGWSGWYKGWYFRSLRELSFFVKIIENKKLKWKTGECKDLQIKYVDWQGHQRTYRPDFLIEDKFVIEIKPEKLFKTPTVQSKKQAAEKFCEERGWEYKLVDIKILSEDEIKTMYLANDIKFLPKYEEKFKERYLCKESQ